VAMSKGEWRECFKGSFERPRLAGSIRLQWRRFWSFKTVAQNLPRPRGEYIGC